ncbi:hypothetical protein EYE40_12780 [Glaciihabitans arcticus]|uniref:Uncharacterized protein n=1 Tax=Glaciihabitans arcticus TaxID=2668039 RepID=A0A4Q9GVC8_9MICO|nr:hypothetical protein [Glaciihabitans arcticus]TBN58194.1 hypothetical protein EYE40_12780 [Glaciihabitans arcticus]
MSDLDALLLALPGVVSLYATEPAVARSARELVSGTRALVEVSPERIVANVAVDASAQAPVTAAAIADAIRATLPYGATTEIVVRISRVSLD